MSKRRFTLTEKHIKLLRGANIQWDDSSYEGSAGMDIKRPYGNKSIANDIHFLLTGEHIGRTDSKRDSLTEKEEDRYLELHRETEHALAIVLLTASFVPGEYECDDIYRDWKLVQ